MKRLFAVLLVFSPSFTQAHDFWMDFGRQWNAAPGETLSLRFLVGHAGESEDWNLKPERIVAFQAIGGTGASDLKAHVFPAGPNGPGGANLSLKTRGSYLLAFETNATFIELDAVKFQAYLKEEGLTPALDLRKRQGREDEPGTELYSRRAKAIVQAGDAATDSVSTPVGHTLEIVPEKNPLLLSARDPLPVRVYYKGKPLPGVSVHLESLSVGLAPEVTKITDAKGRVAFDLPRKGAWKVDAVWTEPIEDPRADFSTVFASLTFSYP
jgi:uncharacterized GH25 family protein